MERKYDMAHKIMIVDDDRINSTLVKFGLAEKRYEVFQAQSGLEALAALHEFNPDLIILDVMMPKMNGYEFMAELKTRQGVVTTPVIMLTANANMEDLFRVEGVKEYFVKPVEIPRLVSKILEILGENPV